MLVWKVQVLSIDRCKAQLSMWLLRRIEYVTTQNLCVASLALPFVSRLRAPIRFPGLYVLSIMIEMPLRSSTYAVIYRLYAPLQYYHHLWDANGLVRWQSGWDLSVSASPSGRIAGRSCYSVLDALNNRVLYGF